MNFKLSDFKVGDKAYIELTGNASRHKTLNTEECIIECVIESVGRKYVTAKGVKFEEHNFSYGGLIEHTTGCVDYVLYPDKHFILDRFECENLCEEIKNTFSGFGHKKSDKLSLDQLRRIKLIIEEVQ